jgi:ribose transport system ATP-binding protein
MIRQAVDAGAAAIVVSSDHEELEQVCDRVLVLADGRVAAELGPGHVDAARISHLTLDAAPVAAGA